MTAAAGSAWSLLWTPLRTQRRATVVLGAYSPLEAVPVLASGWLVARATDDGFLAGRPATGLAWLLTFGVAAVVGGYAGRQALPRVAEIAETLRDHLVRYTVDGALRRAVHEPATADAASVARITRQTEMVRQIVAALLSMLRNLTLSIGSAVAGLLLIAPGVAVVVVAAVLVSVVVLGCRLRALRPRQAAVLVAEEDVSRIVGATVAGVRDVAACAAERRARRDVDRELYRHAAAARRLARTGASGVLVVAVGARLPLVLLLVAAVPLVRSGSLTAGALLGAATYLVTGLEPALRSLVQALGQLGLQLGSVLHRLAAGCAPPPSTRAGASAADRFATRAGRSEPRPAGRIELRGLTFAHGPYAEPVLRDVTLDIPAGYHLAVVGPSGAGKSTLAYLLAGHLAPGRGAVTLDGDDVSHMDDSRLRGTVTLVPQEAYVFAGSVRENLTWLAGSVAEPALLRAVADFGLTAVVSRLGGLDGEITDASTLSAGERQLLTLVRTYLAPAAVTILDEATCHLDPVFEARAERLFAARGGTLIVIAHRISSAYRADGVLMLEDGCATIGRHQYLIRVSPLYAEMVGLWQAAGRPST